MISIIICSRSKEAVQIVSENVAATIGVPFEVIAVDNSGGEYSIFQAYNIGIRQSKYAMLCFMHEDISFETNDWGAKVLSLFAANTKLGLLGVAGSNYKAVFPSGWSFAYAKKGTTFLHIVQQYKSTKTSKYFCTHPADKSLHKVVSVDGVWFCTPKSIAEKLMFDEVTFNNFHCYDLDFSLGVLKNHDVAVTFEILINHFSEGSFNDTWITETLKLHDKWRAILPVNLARLSKEEQGIEEFNAFHTLLPQLVGKKNICMDIMKFMWRSNLLSLVGAKRFAIMNLLLIKKMTQ